jgi:hypothetical protein
MVFLGADGCLFESCALMFLCGRRFALDQHLADLVALAIAILFTITVWPR